MRPFIIRFIIALLAFNTGLFASYVCDRWQQIVDVYVELMLNYQD
jgi:hypothetical protein